MKLDKSTLVFLSFCAAVVLSATLINVTDIAARKGFVPVEVKETISAPAEKDPWEMKMDVARYIIKQNPHVAHDDALGYAVTIVDFSTELNLDWKVIAAIIQTESNFREDSVGKGNPADRGAGQVNVKWWAKDLKAEGIIKHEKDLHRIDTGTRAACFVFKKMLDREGGDYYRAIKAYKGNDSSEYLMKVVETVNRYQG